MPNTGQTITFDDTPDDEPAGYRQVNYGAPETYAGPYYEREEAGQGQVGFRVKARHLNHAGLCHGGIIATFCDLQVRPIKAKLGLVEFSPTVTISVDFVESGREGDWIWMAPTLVKQTRKLLFTQALVMAEDRVVARTNAIYRILHHNTGAREPAKATS